MITQTKPQFFIMNKQQILDFTSAFPPAQKLTETLMEVDYKKHYNTFMDFVVVFCAAIAAVFTVLRDKWVEYDCTERVQLAAETVKVQSVRFYNWNKDVSIPYVKNTAIPFVKDTVNEIRSYYNVMKLAQSV